MLEKLAKFCKGTKAKALLLMCALMAPSSFAADVEQLDSLKTTLGTVTTKAGDVMTAIGSLALVIVIGVIVVKLIKKGSRAG